MGTVCSDETSAVEIYYAEFFMYNIIVKVILATGLYLFNIRILAFIRE